VLGVGWAGAGGDDTEGAIGVKLIARLDGVSDDLATDTLLFFEALLGRACEHTLEALVLRNFVDVRPAEAAPLLVEADVDRVTQVFLTLVPVSLRSSRDDSFAAYFSDAEERVRQAVFAGHRWQCGERSRRAEAAQEADRDPTKLIDFSDDADAASTGGGDDNGDLEGSRSRRPRYIGRFLTALLTTFERTFTQPYHNNLIVTGIITHLASLPLACLVDFFLSKPDPPVLVDVDASPSSMADPEQPSLYASMHKLSREANATAERMPKVVGNLAAMRQQLDMEGGDAMGAFIEEDHEFFLRGTIVFEEFCKEMATIALVKKGMRDNF